MHPVFAMEKILSLIGYLVGRLAGLVVVGVFLFGMALVLVPVFAIALGISKELIKKFLA